LQVGLATPPSPERSYMASARHCRPEAIDS
jgi:hypothetical protein